MVSIVFLILVPFMMVLKMFYLTRLMLMYIRLIIFSLFQVFLGRSLLFTSLAWRSNFTIKKMLSQRSTFFSSKYKNFKSSNTFAHALTGAELTWVKNYSLSDGRITMRSKLLLKDFFGGNSVFRSTNRSLLRSQCLASGAKRGITAYSFWASRHVLNERFKRGWVSGFRKC